MTIYIGMEQEKSLVFEQRSTWSSRLCTIHNSDNILLQSKYLPAVGQTANFARSA
jgi:hypothetical protein